MDALTLTALGKALDKQAKKARGELEPGEHTIAGAITLAYDGTIKVSEDEHYTPTADIPFKTALALFVHHAGITGSAARDALIKAMTEALEVEKLKGKDKARAIEAIREITDLEAAEQAVREGLDKLPAKTRKGKVAATVTVKEVTRLINNEEEKEAA